MRAIFAAVAVTCAFAWGAAAWAQTPQPQDPAAARVQVSEFVVTGNDLLPEAQLQQVLAPFKGERTLAELKQAAQAVQDLYSQAGFGAVIAYLPEQTDTAGRVTIAVLEGRIVRVVVSGNKQYTEGNIRASLPLLKEGLTPQVQKIDAEIQLANENASKQVAVSLEPGAAQGEVIATVSVQELPASRWTLSADNTGNASTGRTRVSLGYANAALWDLDHSVSLQYQTSPEKPSRVEVLSGSYRIPLYSIGAALEAFAAHSNVDGGTSTTAAGPLQFSGRGNVMGLRFTDYLMRRGELDQRLIFGVDQREYLNNCAITGLPDGACGSAGASVTVHPVSIEYTTQTGGARNGGPAAGFNISVARNLNVGGRFGAASDFDAVRAGAKPNYTAWRSGLFGSQPLPGDWQLQARANGQWSDTALVQGEQFGIGGAASVRGYEEREIVGDSGYVGSFELYSPDFAARLGAAASTARVLAFVDGGHVWNELGLPCRDGQTRCTLASVGMGLRLGSNAWQLHADVARAAKAAAQTRSGDYRLHFQAGYSFN